MGKKLASILLCAVLVFFIAGGVSAKTTTKNMQGGASDQFIDYVSEYFENHSKYEVLDKSGTDINEQFYQDNFEYYLQSDFDKIHENFVNNLTSFAYVEEQIIDNNFETIGSSLNKANDNDIVLYATRTKYVSKWFYKLCTSNQTTQNLEIQYTIHGSFTYNPVSDLILYCSSPSVTMDWDSGGLLWSNAYMQNVSTHSSISSNQSTATFSASFQVYATLGFSLGTLPLGYTVNFGSVSNSFTADSGESSPF